MRVAALHRDVLVATSRAYQTNAIFVRSGSEAFLVDSPVLPDELDVLPAVAEQSGFPVVGLLATHGDWDHLLGRMAFRDAPLGVAESTASRLQRDLGSAQRELREFDDELYVSRPMPLQLSAWQALPVPGTCEVGEAELELHEVRGHAPDGMAIVVPWASVLLVGDHVSPVEIPWLAEGLPGAVGFYLETLDRLEGLIEAAEWVVPGHGEPLDPERALAILREDRAYLQALRERGADAPLPLARRTAAQRRIHALNVERAAGG